MSSNIIPTPLEILRNVVEGNEMPHNMINADNQCDYKTIQSTLTDVNYLIESLLISKNVDYKIRFKNVDLIISEFKRLSTHKSIPLFGESMMKKTNTYLTQMDVSLKSVLESEIVCTDTINYIKATKQHYITWISNHLEILKLSDFLYCESMHIRITNSSELDEYLKKLQIHVNEALKNVNRNMALILKLTLEKDEVESNIDKIQKSMKGVTDIWN